MYCLWFGSSQYIIVDAIKFRMINLTLISILFGRRHRLNGLNGTKKKRMKKKHTILWRRFGRVFWRFDRATFSIKEAFTSPNRLICTVLVLDGGASSE